MLQHSHRWTEFGASLSVCDASAVSRVGQAFSLLVASLGDPYNTSAFWRGAYRALRPGGAALFTMPSFEWSSRFRGNAAGKSQLAEFVLKDGRCLHVPSCVMSLHEQVKMIEDAGFAVVRFASLGADLLHPGEPHSPKLDVFGDDVSSIVWGFEVIRKHQDVRS
jgi:hypothetical protein